MMMRSAIIIAIVSLLVAAFGCSGPPDSVVKDYMGNLLRLNYPGVLANCTGQAYDLAKSTAATSVGRMDYSYGLYSKLPDMESGLGYAIVESAPRESVVTVSAGGEEVAKFLLVRVNGGWKISDGPHPTVIISRLIEIIKARTRSMTAEERSNQVI